MGEQHTGRERLLWAIGILVVLLYALIPVAWIASLSFKTPEEVGDKKFFSGFSFENYDVVFSDDTFIAALINSIGIASIATFISIVLAAMAAYATSRLDFTGKTLILSGALAVAMFPPISIVGSLFDMWRSLGIYDTWIGLIIPYMTFTLPLAIYTLSAFFREIPWELEQAAQVDGATPFQAFRKIIVPLAAPGRLHGCDPRLHLRLERLHLREHADLDRRRADGARGARVLHRSVPVRAADRRDLGRLGRGHGPDHHHGPDLPAPNRRGPHRRRGEGIKGEHDGPDHAGQPHQALSGRLRGRARHEHGDQGRRVRDPRRAVRLRQVDRAAHDRGARGHHRGRAAYRRRRGERQGAEGPRHRDGVPELRALSAHERARQHGLRAQAASTWTRTRSTRR